MARRPQSVPDRILAAATRLATERPWNDVTLVEIAQAARVDLAALYEAFPSKSAIIAGLMARADRQVMAGTDMGALDEPARERLLDAVLRRLEALEPHKPAIRSMMRGAMCDPVQALCVMPAFYKAIATTLEAAGIGSTGLGGRIRVEGLGAIYLAALCVWLRDDSEDKGRTMAFLDRRLRMAERLAAFLPGGRRAPAKGKD